jgi:hypothetical protein
MSEHSVAQVITAQLEVASIIGIIIYIVENGINRQSNAMAITSTASLENRLHMSRIAGLVSPGLFDSIL